jgi:hypothetical protein
VSSARPVAIDEEVRFALADLASRSSVTPRRRDLAQQMLAYVEIYNQTAKPFKWTYRVAGINRPGERK